MNGIKKIFAVITVIIILFTIVFIISAWNLGVFSSVTITIGKRGPYYLVRDKQKCSYEIIGKRNRLIQQYLAKKNITPLFPAGIIIGNPLEAALPGMNAFAACVIKDSCAIDTSFVLQKIEKRSVLIAAVKANQSIGPFKAYPALADYIIKDDLQQDTSKVVIELYDNDHSLEIELPVLTDTAD